MAKLILPLILLLTAFTPVIGQVSVAPPNVFIDDQHRFGVFIVANNSDSVQEVDIEFLFGYAASDSEGNTVMEYNNVIAEELYSAAGWIRAYPRVFVLNPGEQQTVRLNINPPSVLEDGMYWARIKTGSLALRNESTDSETSARLNIKIEQITALFFKKGDVKTGVRIHNLDLEKENGSLNVLAKVSRLGNAPFLGSIETNILDSAGRKVLTDKRRATVYLDAVRKATFDISNLEPGEYSTVMTFLTERSDIPASDIVQAEPVSQESTFIID